MLRLTDDHQRVLAVLELLEDATPDRVATVLGCPVDEALTLLEDLERAGFIDSHTIH